MRWQDVITIDPQIMHGAPCFRGTPHSSLRRVDASSAGRKHQALSRIVLDR